MLSESTEGEADSGEGSGVVAALQAARDCHQLLQEGRVLGVRAAVETSSGDVGINSRSSSCTVTGHTPKRLPTSSCGRPQQHVTNILMVINVILKAPACLICENLCCMPKTCQ